MSRAYHPPDTLSKEDVKVIADVRRDIWKSGLYGLGIGSATGLALHLLGHLGNNRKVWNLPLNRNTALASFMLGGAIGSFTMATTTGKNEVYQLHPIYGRGARTPNNNNNILSYEESLKLAKEKEKLLNQDMTEEEVERILREKNRLYRRSTLHHAIYDKDHGGLNDAHGGQHWLIDDLDIERSLREKNRLYRQATIQRTISNQSNQHGGLSDAHGGHWLPTNNSSNDSMVTTTQSKSESTAK